MDEAHLPCTDLPPRGAGPQLLGLECLDVFKAVDDAAAELDEMRTFPGPAPALESAVGNIPAVSQIDLIEVLGHESHSVKTENFQASKSPLEVPQFSRE